MTSNILTTLGFDGSIKARTSELTDKCLALRNSTLNPWNFGVETSLPS